MKILAFGGSTSSTSINRQLANYTAGLIKGAQVTELDLNDFDLPIFSEDIEKSDGIPPDAQEFLDVIRAHDAIVVSLAEHNGSYSAAFKNLYDWTSRIEVKLWSDKPMLLMATSPGAGGARFVLEAAETKFPRMGADLKATFSLPSFYDNFGEDGIKDAELAAKHREAVATFSQAL